MDAEAWDRVRATLLDVHAVPEVALARLRPMLTVRRLKRGQYFLREGTRAEMAAVVLDGVLREFFMDDLGREHTRGFSYERTLTGSLSDLLEGTAARLSLEALTDVRVAQVPWRHFDELARIDPAWGLFTRRLAERSYSQKAERERRLLSLSAGERYAEFVAERGALLERVQLRHVASYLGITPEHLSRLRRVG